MAVGGVKLLVDVVAFAYPAYMSFKALETSTSVDDKQWYEKSFLRERSADSLRSTG